MWRLLMSMVFFQLFHRSKACSITTKRNYVRETIGDSTKLQWEVKTSHNKIFSSIQCTKDKTTIASGSIRKFETSPFLRDVELKSRLQTTYDKKVLRNTVYYDYTINIGSLQLADSGTYTCSILCIAEKGEYLSSNIELTVEEKTTHSIKTSTFSTRHFTKDVTDSSKIFPTISTVSNKTSRNSYVNDKRNEMYIWIGVTAAVLFVLIVISAILCIKKKFYKLSFENKEKAEVMQTVTLLEASTRNDFEEQQYADLTEHRNETQSTDFDLKSALWPAHEYEYIKTVGLHKNKHNTSVKSEVYEYIDPNFKVKTDL